MPYRVQKLKSGRYRMSGPSGVRAKSSTKANVEAQLRLLRMIDHGGKPRRK